MCQLGEGRPTEARAATRRKTQPIAAPCSSEFKAVHHSGTRSLKELRWIIVHSTEGSTARGAASWFANPASRGSAHLCVDDNECYRTLSDSKIPWAAQGANTRGFHIEMAGFARWSAYVWGTKHRRTINRAAYKAALRCKKYGIPARWRTATELRAGKKGISSHANCSKAFGGDHWDPGPGFPRRLFMRRVRYYLSRM